MTPRASAQLAHFLGPRQPFPLTTSRGDISETAAALNRWRVDQAHVRSRNDQAPRVSFGDPKPVGRAVILAAGQGTRLERLAAGAPKCLVELDGQSLLERALDALASQGVAEAVIVIGYRSEAVRERIGSRFAGVDISYIEAPDFETTNNIRSLWDAREYLDTDVLLVEADIAFDPSVIGALLLEPGSSVAVAPYHRGLSGTVVRTDERGHVTSFLLRADQDEYLDASATFKTVNIYLLREELLRDQVVPRLCRAIEAGHVHDYYESILGDCVRDETLTELAAVDVSASRWCEVDDHRDVGVAEFLFLDRDAQFDRVQGLYGSYWRYGFTDHSYLYNMHFPPTSMLEVFQGDLRNIVTNYPVGQSELARLAAMWVGAKPDHLAVANGAAELIKILGNQFVRRLTIPTPSFNEYEEVVAPDGLNRFPLEPGTFELDVDAFRVLIKPPSTVEGFELNSDERRLRQLRRDRFAHIVRDQLGGVQQTGPFLAGWLADLTLAAIAHQSINTNGPDTLVENWSETDWKENLTEAFDRSFQGLHSGNGETGDDNGETGDRSPLRDNVRDAVQDPEVTVVLKDAYRSAQTGPGPEWHPWLKERFAATTAAALHAAIQNVLPEFDAEDDLDVDITEADDVAMREYARKSPHRIAVVPGPVAAARVRNRVDGGAFAADL